jgi:hypothetical protein
VIAWFVLGVGLLIAVLLAGRAMINANPATLAKVLRYGGATLFGVIAAFFAVTGRLALAGPFGILATICLGAGSGSSFPGFPGRSRRGPSPGQGSEISTRCLRMSLDHDTGNMNGTVLEGPYKGADLATLNFSQLIEVYVYLSAEDSEGATLLATYLERDRPADWGTWQQTNGGAQDGPPTTSEGTMSPDEALRILGLGEGATVADIKAAHKRLMKKMHPDQGGSTYLASKINRAKEILLELMNRNSSR